MSSPTLVTSRKTATNVSNVVAIAQPLHPNAHDFFNNGPADQSHDGGSPHHLDPDGPLPQQADMLRIQQVKANSENQRKHSQNPTGEAPLRGMYPNLATQPEALPNYVSHLVQN